MITIFQLRIAFLLSVSHLLSLCCVLVLKTQNTNPRSTKKNPNFFKRRTDLWEIWMNCAKERVWEGTRMCWIPHLRLGRVQPQAPSPDSICCNHRDTNALTKFKVTC